MVKLRAELTQRGQPSDGKKPSLVIRLLQVKWNTHASTIAVARVPAFNIGLTTVAGGIEGERDDYYECQC